MPSAGRLALALSLAILGLSGCAKKHRVTASSAPAPQIHPEETGLASWYGHPYHGRAASNGEIYDMEKLTAAHRTLPFGTWVHVTNLANNKSVDVRIIDRGPFVNGRVIDLSHAAVPPAGTIDLLYFRLERPPRSVSREKREPQAPCNRRPYHELQA